MNTPNLFDFATSELSQDAFICWLAAWGDAAYAKIDPCLHEVGKEFVLVLMEKARLKCPENVEKVEVQKQWQHIDVLIKVNDRTNIVIEDKIGSSQSNDQLSRYKKIMEECGVCEENLGLIYFKTEEQSALQNVVKEGYVPFLRQDILNVLMKGIASGVTNNIFLDYYKSVSAIHEECNSWRTTSLDAWSWRAWTGFYATVQDRLGAADLGWDYVPNPTGGFLGLWWSWKSNDDGTDVYLQLEKSKLCLKIDVGDKENRSELRNAWHALAMAHPLAATLKLGKPARFGNGTTMTFAVSHEDYRAVGLDGLIDFETTITTLLTAQKLLYSIADQANTYIG